MTAAVLGAPRIDASAELRAMMRDVPRAGGVGRILNRIGRRLDCRAVLVDPTEDATVDDPPLRALGTDILAVSTGGAVAVSTSFAGRAACVLPVAGGPGAPVLVVLAHVRGQEIRADQRSFLADAVVPLGLAWQMRAVRHRSARLDRAEEHAREAVLRLLLAGAVAGARRAADVLGPRLPDVVRVHLVECAGRRVTETVRWCAERAAGAAWIVRCPVYTRHIVVFARPDAHGLVDALRLLAASDTSYHVGSSPEAPITDFATAYRHAFHALSVARHQPERYAAFRARGELSEILSGIGAGWAARTLAPLLAYEPARPQDPDAEELMFTLTSWLTFHHGALRHLKVHRNTLSARLRMLSSLLDVDLADVAAQARLNLAAQLLAATGGPYVTFTALLDRPEVRHWAHTTLEPLRGSDPRIAETLRAWLAHRAHISTTAAALGVSVSGVRKRLVRVETLVQRSLLDSPSARYDLCLALQAVADRP